MSARAKRIADLQACIEQVRPDDAAVRMGNDALLVDVREPDETTSGSPRGAERLSRGFLELRIEEIAPDLSQPLLLMCAGGVRSLFAAASLKEMGYCNVASVAGGFDAWKAQGLPVEQPMVLDSAQRERYGRHLLMPEVGEEGQRALLDARVLLVGAGGLGSPAALYLAAAGVGCLGIIDDDTVDRSNLQRQILHSDASVGRRKVDSARERLLSLNPTIEVVGIAKRLSSMNVEEVLEGWDIVIDGSDNFPTRYLLNDACIRLGLPCIHGSIYRFDGQLTTFWPGRPNDPGPCYRCLYPQPPAPEHAPSCAEAGVLGVLPGVIGTMQAVETVKLILGVGRPLVGRLLAYDALEQTFMELELARDPACAYCADGAAFPGYVDYARFCAGPAASTSN